MASKQAVLNTKRQKSLEILSTACRHHRGVKAARNAAMRDTLMLLKIEIKERAEADARAKRQERAAPSQRATLDLFQALH